MNVALDRSEVALVDGTVACTDGLLLLHDDRGPHA